ncbi:hypothetical protein ACOME3_004124 [Neoechinorhynchus agilis]
MNSNPIKEFFINIKDQISMAFAKMAPKMRNAIDVGNVSEISRLVQKNPKILETEINGKGDYPLGYAIKIGSIPCVHELVKLNSNLNCVNYCSQIGALAFAASMSEEDPKMEEIVEYLIDNDANANVSYIKLEKTASGDSYGEAVTALVEAIKNNNLNIVRMLIEKGNADVNHRCPESLHTPLLWAAAVGNPDIIMLLIKYGADVDAYSGDGSNVLHWLTAILRNINVNAKTF